MVSDDKWWLVMITAGLVMVGYIQLGDLLGSSCLFFQDVTSSLEQKGTVLLSMVPACLI